MKKKISIILILIFFLFSLTGCYDARTIENSYYIVALGIDKGSKQNYEVSIQIAKNSKSGGESSGESSQSSAYSIYTVEAETINSAINILNNYLNKKINMSHCSAIIFAEEVAKQGLGDLVNSLANNHEVRPNTYVLISSKKAVDVLDKVSNAGENFSSRFYEYIINSFDYTGYSVETTFSNFLSEINNDSGDGKAIYTSVEKDNIQNHGLAIFKNDRMIGHTSAIESVAHLLLINKLEESSITFESPFEENSKIDLEISIMKDCHKNVEIINNTPFISCEIFVNGNIISSGKNFDYTSSENIHVVEKKAEKYLETIIKNYLYTLAKEYNADILNFNTLYSTKCLTNQELEKAHFKDIYKESYFNVDVHVEIASTHLFEK